MAKGLTRDRNYVQLIGRLSRDPELKYVGQANRPVCNFTVACGQMVERDGQNTEMTAFVPVTAWGSTAESIARHLVKGSPIMVEGRLYINSWEDKHGQKRRDMTVTVEFAHYLYGVADEFPNRETGPRQPRDVFKYTPPPNEPPRSQFGEETSPAAKEADIPF